MAKDKIVSDKMNRQAGSPVMDKIPKEKKAVGNGCLKLQVLIFILMTATVGAAGYLYGQSVILILRNLVMTVIGMSAVIFRLRQIELEQDICKKQEIYEPKRFYVWFIHGIILSVAFPLLPTNGWPYPVIAVILALFSESLVGILSSALLIFVSVSLAGADFSVFYLYFSCSVFSVILFQRMDEEFKFGIPVFLSGLSIILATTAEVILVDAERLSIESFIIPCINVFITTLFYLIFLKYYSVTKVHRFRDKYMTITDPEYSLMIELKMKSKESYYHAIHTAHFSDKIAVRLNCDAILAKAGGYYHRLSSFCDNATIEEYEKLLLTHEFPPRLCQLLLNYNSRNKKVVEKETAIIYFSDAVVSSIMYLFKKNPEMEIAYDQVIDTIFDKKMESGVLNQCELSISDFVRMKRVFKEEKLYYDFLR